MGTLKELKEELHNKITTIVGEGPITQETLDRVRKHIVDHINEQDIKTIRILDVTIRDDKISINFERLPL